MYSRPRTAHHHQTYAQCSEAITRKSLKALSAKLLLLFAACADQEEPLLQHVASTDKAEAAKLCRERCKPYMNSPGRAYMGCFTVCMFDR